MRASCTAPCILSSRQCSHLTLLQAAGGPTQQLQAAEIMLARYGQENERLAAINEALVSRRAFVDSDYTSKPQDGLLSSGLCTRN